jgi:uncharacterized RDD family membrane protein YckC
MANDINYIMGNPPAKEHWIRRTFAFIIDLVVILVLYFIAAFIIIMIIFAYGINAAEGMTPSGSIALTGSMIMILVLVSIMTFICTFLYFIVMDGKMGGTLGKRLLGLRVEALDGYMDLRKGTLRNLSKLAGIFIGSMTGGFIWLCLITIVLVGIDIYMGTGRSNDPRQKHTDIMAGTTVVRTDVVENLHEMHYEPPVPPPMSLPEEPSETPDEGVTTTSPDMTVSKEPAEEVSVEQFEMVRKYQEFFGISRERATNLYKAGYKSLDHFADAIPEDLILVDKINPTVARAIIKKASGEE